MIVAVTGTGVPGSTVAASAGVNSTFQPVGVVELKATPVTGAEPVLARLMANSFAEPALAVVDRTWSGVPRVSV